MLYFLAEVQQFWGSIHIMESGGTDIHLEDMTQEEIDNIINNFQSVVCLYFLMHMN